MSGVIQISIQYEDGGYTASGINAPIATFGRTFEELQSNLAEAVAVFLKGEEPSMLGFVRSPSVFANFELPVIAYGDEA